MSAPLKHGLKKSMTSFSFHTSSTLSTHGSWDECQDGLNVVSSRWRLGWRVPTAMISFYALALLFIQLHLALFLYLDCKPAEGEDRAAPQSYVSTASNILSNGFAYSLKASMVVAFTQQLWHLLRVRTLKISTIDKLFSLPANPFLLLEPVMVKTTLTLSAIALLMWAVQIAASFPPGALTITLSDRMYFSEMLAPSFNASFMGSGSGRDAFFYSLDQLNPDTRPTLSASSLNIGWYSSSMQRLATQTLINGAIRETESPCGANCSYTVNFEAPYFECKTQEFTSPVLLGNNSIIYTAEWQSPFALAYTNDEFINITNTSDTLNPLIHNTCGVFTTTVLSISPTSIDVNNAVATNTTTTCIPRRANYSVVVSYKNGAQSITPTVLSTAPILDLLASDTADWGQKNITGFYNADVSDPQVQTETDPLNWNPELSSWYRNLNIMAIVDALAVPLSGSFTAISAILGPAINSTDPEANNASYPISWIEWFEDIAAPEVMGGSLSGPNHSIIASTRFSTAFEHFPTSKTPLLETVNTGNLALNVNSDILNEALLNITFSVIAAFGHWTAPVNASITKTVNIYSFSNPLKFYLPYYLFLGITLPILVLGFWALVKNGVGAMDGSFIQLLATTRGSMALEAAATGGCLGGWESCPGQLRDLEIRFGELKRGDEDDGANRNEKLVRRAGFGTKDEIVTLTKGALYGVLVKKDGTCSNATLV